MYINTKFNDAGAVVFNMQNYGGVFTLSQIEFEMMQMYASKKQKQTYAWVKRLHDNENTLGGFIMRCMCAPEEAGYIRKDIRNLKNLQNSLWDIPDAGEVLERLDYFIRSMQLILKNYAERTEVVCG